MNILFDTGNITELIDKEIPLFDTFESGEKTIGIKEFERYRTKVGGNKYNSLMFIIEDKIPALYKTLLFLGMSNPYPVCYRDDIL